MIKRIFMTIALALVTVLPLKTYAAPDCDSNAVIWCGAPTSVEFSKAVSEGDGHNSASDIANIYAATGVNPSLINSTVEGVVTREGKVKLNDGRTVATEAQSVGRTFIEGSTQRGHVWVRPTSVSFAGDSLEAFVYIQNNQFMWAVIKACGNPVIAKPVIAVTAGATTVTTPTPPPVAPQATPLPPVAPPPPVTIPKTGPNAPILVALACSAMWLGLQSFRKSRQSLRQAFLRS